MVERTPIAVVYKYRRKVYVKEFKDLRTPDALITNRSTKLPYQAEILQIGVGSKFYQLYKNKHL
mgnify:FL=1|tara:strand:+ start:795 stop:986 length:192 start_codon:yes stop_codon:yes gene_type:complete